MTRFLIIAVFVLLTACGNVPTTGETAIETAGAQRSTPAANEASTPTNTTQPTQAPEPTPTESRTMSFNRENYHVLHANPKSHEGAKVTIVGRVFQAPERDKDGVGWQMWADPKNNEWNTIVFYPDPGLEIKNGDYVRIEGTVKGEYSGENAFGATLTVPVIMAEVAEVVDATAVASPPVRVVELGETQTQHNLSIEVQKVEFAKDETRIFATVRNDSDTTASFYSFNAKATQGSRQFDTKSFSDYPEIQSEILPGITSSGIIVFPSMAPAHPTKLFLEGRTDNFSLEFKPYVFDIPQ